MSYQSKINKNVIHSSFEFESNENLVLQFNKIWSTCVGSEDEEILSKSTPNAVGQCIFFYIVFNLTVLNAWNKCGSYQYGSRKHQKKTSVDEISHSASQKYWKGNIFLVKTSL